MNNNKKYSEQRKYTNEIVELFLNLILQFNKQKNHRPVHIGARSRASQGTGRSAVPRLPNPGCNSFGIFPF